MDRARTNRNDSPFAPDSGSAPGGAEPQARAQRSPSINTSTSISPAKRREGVFGTGASASHAILFTETRERRCDVCAIALDTPEAEEADLAPYSTSGAGMYLWSRGGEVVREDAPLCSDCGGAIAVTAFMRYQNEDEEG